jgi:two-component system nitrate/nitrite response regulator NarL
MIRVLIVDAVRLMCDAIASVLDDQPDMQVIGCATNVSEAIDSAKSCDIILVNANLPDDGAYRLIRALTTNTDYREKISQPRIMVVGLVESRNSILRWVEAGARGYIRKEASVDEMLTNIRSVSQGNARVSPEVAGALMERLAEFATLFEDIDGGPLDLVDLTPRETEVLKLLGCYFTNQEIADHLVVEVGTVKNHVHNILTKLNVSNRQEAAMVLAANRDEDQTIPRPVLAEPANALAG